MRAVILRSKIDYMEKSFYPNHFYIAYILNDVDHFGWYYVVWNDGKVRGMKNYSHNFDLVCHLDFSSYPM